MAVAVPPGDGVSNTGVPYEMVNSVVASKSLAPPARENNKHVEPIF